MREDKTMENEKQVTKSQPKRSRGGRYAAIAALLLLLGGGYGFGTGKFSIGDGTGGLPGENEQIPDTIIIKISENEVTVNGQKCADKEELKAYLEKVYSDDRIFILEDENAILASYEWVEKACNELGIDLKK